MLRKLVVDIKHVLNKRQNNKIAIYDINSSPLGYRLRQQKRTEPRYNIVYRTNRPNWS